MPPMPVIDVGHAIDSFVRRCLRLGPALKRGAGRCFGRWPGRPMDITLVVSELAYDPDQRELTIRFRDDGVVRLRDPSGFYASRGTLTIHDASSLVFEWFDECAAKSVRHLHHLELARPIGPHHPAFELA